MILAMIHFTNRSTNLEEKYTVKNAYINGEFVGILRISSYFESSVLIGSLKRCPNKTPLHRYWLRAIREEAKKQFGY